MLIVGATLLAMLASGGTHAPAASKPEPKKNAAPLAESHELQSRPDEPFRLVRKILAENDRLALGGDASDSRRRESLKVVGERLLATQPQDWSLRRNKIAAVIYALSGGHPAVITTLNRKGYLKDLETPLVDGALAYSEGRPDDASTAFASVDPLAYPSTLAAPLFLVKGVLASGSADAEAMVALDWARLMAPASLVEESALRRQAVIALRTGDVALSVQFLAKWMRRFPQSTFAADFFDRYLVQLLDSNSLSPTATVETLVSRAEEYPSGSLCRLLIDLSAVGLNQRKLEFVRVAATKAKALAVEGGEDWRRASLYLEAGRAATSQAADALARLQELDASSYEPKERAILAAGISIAGQLLRLGNSEDAPAVEAAAGGGARERAARLVTEAAKILQEAK